MIKTAVTHVPLSIESHKNQKNNINHLFVTQTVKNIRY